MDTLKSKYTQCNHAATSEKGEVHPVPGVNMDFNGKPFLDPEPTNKESLEVEKVQLWRDLKPGEKTQPGDRMLTIRRQWETIKGVFTIDPSNLFAQRPEPTDWQDRALAAEAELETTKSDLDFRRGLFELHLSQLSASQAEAGRLKWLISQVLGELPTKRDWLNPDIEREMKALSPAEKGGEG